MNIEQDYYEIDSLWHEENFHNSMPRFEETATHIPADARTVLDVGCGNGLFLRFLAGIEGRFDQLHGTDRSQAALKRVQAATTAASIDALPFPDKCFHIATCLQVIEHLPVPVYAKGLSEICRVAERYVLISVPNEEDLEASSVTCPECKTRFNYEHHLRRYDNDVMQTLLAPYGFSPKKSFYMGAMKRYHFPAAVKLVSGGSNRGNRRYFVATCPMCAYDIAPNTLAESASSPSQANLDRQTRDMAQKDNLIKAAAKKLLYKDVVHGWIATLYERTNAQL
jgi:ubiquinone/menaquinone biosynthesis C-methylase UbiE